MKYTLSIREAADYDISNAFQYYEDRRLGLGHGFLLCIDAIIAKTEKNPTIYKNVR